MPPQPGAPQQPGNRSAAVQVVMQWLSYGLWEWTLIMLSILLSATLSYYFISSTRGRDYSWLAYIVASMLVLLPFAFVTDRLYAKQEPPHKHGFAAVVQVLNAIVVFLAAIGGLITCVVSIFMLFVNADSDSSTYIAIVSSLVVASLSLLLFLRIMRFDKLAKFNHWFPLTVVIIAGLTAILALAGPFRAEVRLKNDRLIEGNLSSLNNAIHDYARSKGELPNDLSALNGGLSYQGSVKLLVTKGLVTYRKLPASSTSTTNSFNRTTITGTLGGNIGRYELCANYKQEKKAEFSYTSNSTTYIDTSSHQAGKQCYTQEATLGNSIY